MIRSFFIILTLIFIKLIFIKLIFIDSEFYFLFFIVPIILSIAFFTLYERKILAAMQRRRGPNVVGIYGFLQAFADGFKLLSKETILPMFVNNYIFILSPVLTFILSLLG